MTYQIGKVLIANRGEIAVRIAKTCKAMGIPTVAVFSDVDAYAPHVRACDQAVRIGPAQSSESYLNIDRIIEACRATGATAIHPGFGFLSEQAEFSKRCEDEDIIFVGPSAQSIESMGSKQRAKGIADKADVPTVPGYNGEDQSDEVLIEQAKKIGFPALIKASAGGGGKGMRVVQSADDLSDAISAARREAIKGFGDDTLLVEKYLERPRHIEIQVLADTHGNTVHLFERECSIQRRHQKVIEEAPSPALDDELRQAMGEAAVRLVKEMKYENAGTVEFILDESENYYFLEVNTRLQVEHPVTEAITGIDIVKQQILIAHGRPLPFTQEDITHQGAAIECRLYAEDPANDFLPVSGDIVRWTPPQTSHLRIDTGVESGSAVSMHYDPMVAKLITYGPDREAARRRMSRALQTLVAHGLTTNQQFLHDMINLPEVIAGKLHTHLIDESYPNGWQSSTSSPEHNRAAIAVTLYQQQQRAHNRTILPHMVTGYRNNRFQPQKVQFSHGDQEFSVSYIDVGDGQFDIVDDDQRHRVRIASVTDHSITIEDERMVQQVYELSNSNNDWWVQSPDGLFQFAEQERYPLPGSEVPAGGSTAPMTGTVIEIRAEEGDSVSEGDTLMILEAMKMEHNITAELDGVVSSINVRSGAIVNEGDILVVVEDEDDSPD